VNDPLPGSHPAGTNGGTGTAAVRVVLGALGLAAGLWGVRLLLGLDLRDLVDAGIWLVGGVVLHDFVLAPAVLALGLLVVPRLPGPVRAPAVAAAVVVGLVTAAVFPTLGRFGAKPDDPYLLARPYLAWWLGFAGAAAVIAVAASVVRSRARSRTGGPTALPRNGRPHDGRRPRPGAPRARRT
jgi:hypothetical protein